MSASTHAGRDNLSLQRVIFLFLCPNEMFTYHLLHFGIVEECKFRVFRWLFGNEVASKSKKINPDGSFKELLLRLD